MTPLELLCELLLAFTWFCVAVAASFLKMLLLLLLLQLLAAELPPGQELHDHA
jgi:hypothetical protein